MTLLLSLTIPPKDSLTSPLLSNRQPKSTNPTLLRSTFLHHHVHNIIPCHIYRPYEVTPINTDLSLPPQKNSGVPELLTLNC